MIVKNEKELGEALNRQDDTIEIEGDLADKVLRIKATGNVAWVVAIGAVGMALACGVVVMMKKPSAQTVATGLAASGSVAMTGLGTATWTAVAIAAYAGGVSALKQLRKYKITKKDEKLLVLVK